MEQLEEHFLVLNGDLLTTLNFDRLFNAHLSEDSAATIATYSRTVDIDFGVVELDENSELSDFKEKPSFEYKVSMGINVLCKKSVQAIISPGSYLDIPDLMMMLKRARKKVYCYEEKCEWLDIGRVDDYAVANDVFETKKSQFLPSS